MYIYDDNITHKFNEKYKSNGNIQISVNSNLKQFSASDFNNPIAVGSPNMGLQIKID